jgi:hypothetical protein
MSNHPELTLTEPEDLTNLIADRSIHSTKVDDWWVITGTLIDLPKDLPARRPVGTKNLLVCGDKVRAYHTGPILLNDWSDVIIMCDSFEHYNNRNFRREKAVLDDSKEEFRFAFFSQNIEFFRSSRKELLLNLPSEVSVILRDLQHNSRTRVSYITTVIVSRDDIRGGSYLAIPDKLEISRPMPNSLFARLLLTAQHLVDENRVDDANRFLDLLDTLLALDNGAPSWQEFASQVPAMREIIQPRLPGSNRVPELSPAVYRDIAEAYGPALDRFAGNFQLFVDRKKGIEQRIEAARYILSKEADIIRFQELVTQQLTHNFKEASDNVTKAQAAMESQGRRVEGAERRFQAGLRAWQDRQKKEAAMAIASAAFSFVTGAAKMLTGNPAGAADAANAVKAAEKAATTVKKLVELMKKIAKIVEQVAKIVKLCKTIAAAINKISNAKEFANQMANVRREAESGLGDAPSASAYWDQLWLEVETALAPAAHISGADEYLKELKVMIIYGRALTSAQAAIPPITQELAQSALLAELAEQQHKSVVREIDRLQAGQPASAIAAAALWIDHRSVQRKMLNALQDYDDALHYFALPVLDTEGDTEIAQSLAPRRDPVRSFTDVAGDLLAIANVRARFQRALESFRPRPQNFPRKSFEVPDTAVADLMRDGRFTLRFMLDFGPFENDGIVGRVRVREICVWVIWNEGKRPEKGLMEFTIRTNGEYFDQRVASGRLNQFRFTMNPVNFTFQYNLADEASNPNDPRKSIEIEATIAEEFRDFFPDPTMFTEWQFSLPGYGNDTSDSAATQNVGDTTDTEALKIIDLDDLQGAVKGIRLEFRGSFIKERDRF